MTTTDTNTPAAIDLDATTAKWLEAYREAHNQAEHWQLLAQRAREHVEAALGDAEAGYIDGKPAVRWAIVNSSRIDTKKLEIEHPDIAEQFRVPVITRRFTLAKP